MGCIMQYRLRILVMIGVFCIWGGSASATSHKMEYRILPSSALQKELPFQTKMLVVMTQPPKAVETRRFISRQPLFCWWKSPLLDKGQILIALDQSNGTGPYDLLYCDGNGNDSLTDEEPYRGMAAKNKRVHFGPVEVLVNTSEGKLLYHLAFQFYATTSRQYVWVSSAGWGQGRIKIGNKQFSCTLIDQNANGTWSEAMGEGDMDYVAIGRALRAAGFSGDAVIELAHEGNFKPTRPLRDSLKMSRAHVKKTMGF